MKKKIIFTIGILVCITILYMQLVYPVTMSKNISYYNYQNEHTTTMNSIKYKTFFEGGATPKLVIKLQDNIKEDLIIPEDATDLQKQALRREYYTDVNTSFILRHRLTLYKVIPRMGESTISITLQNMTYKDVQVLISRLQYDSNIRLIQIHQNGIVTIPIEELY